MEKRLPRPHPFNKAATALALLTVVGTTLAAPITVTNFSFESPDITNAVVTGVPTDWATPNGATGIKYRDNYVGLANAGIPDGNQWGLITFSNVGTSNTAVTLAQDTGVTIVEGVTYTLTVAVGEQDNQAPVDNVGRILLYGSTVGDTLPFAILDDIDPIPDANITAGDDSIWIDYQISFTATAAQAGQSLVIGLGAGTNIGNGGSFNSNVSYDNVHLEAESSGSSVAITSFTALGGGDWQVGLAGDAGGGYFFHSSPDLVFDPGTLVENLSQADPDNNPGTVGGANNSVITLDGDGNGTVRMTLTGTKNFVRAQSAPPPPPLFNEDFEADNGDFTSANLGTGTDWAWGAPNSPSQGGGAVTTGNGGSTGCWGTDIGNPGGYIAGTDTVLRSPVIDLTNVASATLSFAQALDIESPHSLVINVIEAATDTVLQSEVHTSTPDTDTTKADWKTVSGVAITGGQQVRLEWRFAGDGDASYLGAYIDDVVVTVP